MLLSTVALNIFAAQNDAIRIDMIGYRNDDNKSVMLVNQAAASFDVRRLDDDTIVYTGNFGPSISDSASGDTCYIGDFTAVNVTGNYRIEVAGLGESFPFTINRRVFEPVFRDAMRAFYGQRCGMEVHLDHASGNFSHLACHTNPATFDAASGFSGTKDVTGGWHDAGDFGKYNTNSGIATGTLLLMYERYGSQIGWIDLTLPEYGRPDVLSEIKYNLDWMLKMQDTASGGVFHKVSAPIPALNLMPENDYGTQHIYRISTCATGDFAAVMAIAARVYIASDPAYAAQCLTAAQSAWAYLQAHTLIVPSGGFNGGDGGEYGDTDDSDERLWAAAELFNTTGLAEYNTYFITYYTFKADPLLGGDWQNLQDIALWSYALSSQPSKNAAAAAAIKTSFTNSANTLLARLSASGYKYTLLPGDYIWGSNAAGLNSGIKLLAAYEMTGNAAYKQGALEMVHYMLGRNPFNTSYVTAEGDRAFMNPHHRQSLADGITNPWPGLIAGGANQFDYNVGAPAKCWQDNVNNFFVNEIAINWQAAFCFVLAAAITADVPYETPTASPTDGCYPLACTPSFTATHTLTPIPTITPTPIAPVRINCGGALYTDTNGDAWQADRYYFGANTWGIYMGAMAARPGDVTNTLDDTLFNSVCYGNLEYRIQLPAGKYNVRLRFSDNENTLPGQRLFNMTVEGALVATNFDIISAAGGPLKYVDRTYYADVNDGILNISLAYGPAGVPLINAIEVKSYDPMTPTVTKTFTITKTLTVIATATQSWTITETPTISPTASASPTKTATATKTPVYSATETPAVTDTVTAAATLTRTVTSTFTPAATAALSGLLIDDFEDDEITYNSPGGRWYFYDGGVNTGSFISSPGGANSTNYAGYLSGNVTSTAGYSSIQAFTDLNGGATEQDVSAYSGLKLFMKGTKGAGTPVSFRIMLQSSNITDFSYWYYDWTPNAAWTQVTIPWGSFTNPGWGDGQTTLISSVAQHLEKIIWAVMEISGAASNNTGNQWYLDEIYFYGGPTATVTPVYSKTSTPTFTATATLTPASSPTQTPTLTATATVSGTVTCTGTATDTATQAPSGTATATCTETLTVTVSSTQSMTMTVTETYTVTLSATVTATSSATGTASRTPTITATNTSSPTPTATSTATGTPAVTATDTASATATATLSATGTFTLTQTPANTPVITDTATRTYTATDTPTLTETSTATKTCTATHTKTATPTSTATKTSTPGNTATATSTPMLSYRQKDLFVIYPNPAKGTLNISVKQGSQGDKAIIRIYTPALRLVRKFESSITASNAYTADLKGLASGMYIIRMEITLQGVVKYGVTEPVVVMK